MFLFITRPQKTNFHKTNPNAAAKSCLEQAAHTFSPPEENGWMTGIKIVGFLFLKEEFNSAAIPAKVAL